MARIYGIDIFAAVERRVQQRYVTLSLAQQRRLADPIKEGQFFMWATADAAASIYAKTQQRGAVLYRLPAATLRYVTHGDIPPALEYDMASMLLEDGLSLQATLEFLLLSYLPDKEAAIITVLGNQIMPNIFTIADQTVRPPETPRKVADTLYTGLKAGLPRDVRQASANHPDGKRYWFFSDSFGSLGRVVVQPRPDGQSQIVSEFAEGDPDPAHSAQRAAIFRVVTDNVFRLFDEKTQN